MDEWQEYSLSQVTDNFDSKRIPVRKSDRKPGPYPYYGASGVTDYVDDYIFDGNYLLIAEDGENLRSRSQPIAFLATGKFWVNNHAHIVKGNNLTDTTFLSYKIQNMDISPYLTGSTRPKLTKGHLNKISLLLPPLEEQQAIASLLGALDDKIDLNRRMNETLEAMARAIFKDWFVDFGPTRAKMEGREPYLVPEIWELFPERLDGEGRPEGWVESSIGNEVDVVGGSTPSTKEAAFWNGDINWATPKDLSPLQTPVLLETSRRITPEGLAKISSGLLPRGTVLLSSRAPIGYLAIAETKVAINQGFIGMRCDKRLSNIFVWLWTLSNMNSVLENANGSTFQEISKKNFRPLPVFVPSSPIVTAFDEMVRPLYKRIVGNELESRTLAQLRDLLLPKLMSGEIRLREAEERLKNVV